jgi:hypothetical protein
MPLLDIITYYYNKKANSKLTTAAKALANPSAVTKD